MTSQTESGKAFEYALVITIYERLQSKQNVNLVMDSMYGNAKRCFEKFNEVEKKKYRDSATSSVDHVLTIEPRLENPITNDCILRVGIQPDRTGQSGDVRDVITVSSDDNWQIGFSAKNNHNAVKHSRLSAGINFGQKWFGISCSDNYMKEATRIFGDLKDKIRADKNLKWSQLPNKAHDYYLPTLHAFQTEICRISKENPQVPKMLIEYLIGRHDFYKIMKYNTYTQIQGYNLHGTLGKPSNSIKPQYKIPVLHLPTEIIRTSIKGDNKLHMILDNGWELSFRIHNARTKVEPSLKFDIQLIGIPNTMYNDRV